MHIPVLLLMSMTLLISQCDFSSDDKPSRDPSEQVDPNNNNKADPNKPSSTQEGGQQTDKVAELSFADSSKLNVEVGEKFDLTINVKNINQDNLADDLEWTDHDGSPMDREGKPDWSSLYVTRKLVVKGKESDNIILHGGYLNDVGDKGGNVKIEGLYFTETCADDCHIVFGLKINGLCVGDSGCQTAQVEPVDEISKEVVVTPNSYAAKVERVNGKNIKLTITKNGTPLANGSAKVSARVVCEEPMDFFGCRVPPNPYLMEFQTPITLDASGIWNTELDADGSWLQKAREAKSDYDLNVCEVMFDIAVDGRVFDDIKPTGGGC